MCFHLRLQLAWASFSILRPSSFGRTRDSRPPFPAALVESRSKPRMVLMSVITCPHCGHAAIERMPSNVCRIFYDCRGCGVRLKPKPGDCCVFCSYCGAMPSGHAKLTPQRPPSLPGYHAERLGYERVANKSASKA